MTDSFTQRVAKLFHRVLETAPDDRAAVLESVDDDKRVIEAVRELLALEEKGIGDFLETPIAARVHQGSNGGGSVGIDRIGAYRVIRHLGEGGFGTVYLAEQEEPIRRRVAIKLLRIGFGPDVEQRLARFDAEREAIARMEHPNVARVLDAGAPDEGSPYLVMEYVRGAATLREFCKPE